jgi:hypothetical protein
MQTPPSLRPVLVNSTAKSVSTHTQFSGRGAGPIKALHLAPAHLPDYEMAEHVARAIAPYGIDTVVHLLPPRDTVAKDTLEGKGVPFHFKLVEDPLTRQMKPLTIKTDQPDATAEQQRIEQIVANMRKGTLNHQPEPFTSHWMQDHVQFGPTHLKTEITKGDPQKKRVYESIAQVYGKSHVEQHSVSMDYGNMFLDIKKPDGSRCHLVGESILNDMKQYLSSNKIIEDKGVQLEDWAKHFLARRLGVKAEEVIYMPEPNFHLDMMMTPLTYPDILVQDPQMCAQVLEAALADLKARPRLSDAQQQEQNELKDLLYKTRKEEAYLTENKYASMAQVMDTLKMHGFNPIPAPLVYGHLDVGPNPDKVQSFTFFGTKEGESDCVNFANAHIHQMPAGSLPAGQMPAGSPTGQMPDGRLVMLTMASSRPSLNRYAKEAILKSLPKGSEVVMMSGGKGPRGYDGDAPKTYFEWELNKAWGGFHCTFAEEMQPSFYANA